MDYKRNQFYLITTLAFLINFLITTLAYYISLFNGGQGIAMNIFGGVSDGYFYWRQALNVANDLPWIKTSIYPWVIGKVIQITNIEDVYVVRVFNYLGYLLLVYCSVKLINSLIAYSDSQELFIEQFSIKSVVVLFLLIYPSLILNINLAIIRDIWIFSLYLLCISLAIRILFDKNKNIVHIILLIPSMYLLWGFRNYIFLSFFLGTFLYIIYDRFLIKISNRRIIIWFLIAFSIYYTLGRNITIPFVNMTFVDALNYREIEDIYSAGGSQMWINLNQSNFILFLINYAHSYFGNVIGPLPWHISGISTLILFFVETIPMLITLIYLYREKALINKPMKYMLFNAFVWFALIASSNDNIGTASRLRVPGWILIGIVTILIYFTKKNQKAGS